MAKRPPPPQEGPPGPRPQSIDRSWPASVPADPVPPDVPVNMPLEPEPLARKGSPINIQVNIPSKPSARHRRQLSPVGWFARSFGSAAGIVLAMILIPAVLMIGTVLFLIILSAVVAD